MSKQLSNKMKSLLMERRKFLSGAAALGVGAGLSASAVIPNAAVAESSDIAWRDRDLRFIGTEETYSTDELIAKIAINDDHAEYLKSLGLSEIDSGRIAAMDDAGLNVQILSVPAFFKVVVASAVKFMPLSSVIFFLARDSD
jgi:hypothetical protein